MALRIRNWKSFQHYKFRKPPWIKLYRELLDDKQWHEVSGDTAKHLIMLWLIASEADGYLPDSSTLAFRLRISENRVLALLSECSHWIEGFASDVLADGYQDATPETETETEKRRENTSPTKTVGVASELGSAEFRQFWGAYPRKLDRQEAVRAWVKGLCDGSIGAILAGLECWKRTEQWQDVDKIPYPSTWLNKRRWKDTPQVTAKLSPAEQKARKTDEAIERFKQRLNSEVAQPPK